MDSTPGIISLTATDLISAAVFFPVVCIALVPLRLRAKRKSRGGWGIDDWLILPPTIFVLLFGIAAFYGIAQKLLIDDGPNSETTTDREFHEIRAIWWNALWMQAVALGCTKLSFVFFFRRIFATHSWRQPFGVACLGIIMTLVLWTLASFLGFMLLCPGHISAFWSPHDVERYCWRYYGLFITSWTWSDVVTDLMVIVLPIIPIWRLHATTTRKLSILAVFSLGAVNLIASVQRAVSYLFISGTSEIVVSTRMYYANAIYWILLETGVAVVAASLPIMYGLVNNDRIKNVFKTWRIKTSTSASSSWKQVTRRLHERRSSLTPLQSDTESQRSQPEMTDSYRHTSGVRTYGSQTADSW